MGDKKRGMRDGGRGMGHGREGQADRQVGAFYFYFLEPF
jgi:hypothetical protein